MLQRNLTRGPILGSDYVMGRFLPAGKNRFSDLERHFSIPSLINKQSQENTPKICTYFPNFKPDSIFQERNFGAEMSADFSAIFRYVNSGTGFLNSRHKINFRL